jgi:hypothetical protein
MAMCFVKAMAFFVGSLLCLFAGQLLGFFRLVHSLSLGRVCWSVGPVIFLHGQWTNQQSANYNVAPNYVVMGRLVVLEW